MSLLDKVYYHKEIIKTLKLYIENRDFPNLIFFGHPGIGKTFTAQLFAEEFYGHMNLTTIINCSVDAGINMVTDKIEKQIGIVTLTGTNDDVTFRTFICDEMDGLSSDSIPLLAAIMDKYSDVRFIFICNYIDAIDKSLVNRCTSLPFKSIPTKVVDKYISSKIEQMDFSDNIVDYVLTEDNQKIISKYVFDDLRKINKILEDIEITFNGVDSVVSPGVFSKFLNIYDYDTLKKILLKIDEGDTTDVMKTINKITSDSIYVVDFIEGFLSLLHMNLKSNEDMLFYIKTNNFLYNEIMVKHVVHNNEHMTFTLIATYIHCFISEIKGILTT